MLDVQFCLTSEMNWNRKDNFIKKTRMSANAQRDGRPTEYRWRPLFNAVKFG